MACRQKTTGLFRTLVRSCIPIIGIAVIIALTEEVTVFLTVLVLPLAVAIPPLSWLTAKIIGQVRDKKLFEVKYLLSYGFCLIIIVMGACFFFLLESIGGHGSYRGLFVLKCLFAVTTILIYPLVDLTLFRISLIADTANIPKIKRITILSNVLTLVAAAYLLAIIIEIPLNSALRLQYRTLAIVLIDSEADLNSKDRYGATPLWWAVHRSDADMARLLFDKGAKLDKSAESNGLTRAIEDNNPEMLKLLLSKGASPNTEYMGATPLVRACQRKAVSMIKMLLDSGADINIKSRFPGMPYDGKSPLDIAYEGGDAQVVELLLTRGRE